jgi:hypothetical protein
MSGVALIFVTCGKTYPTLSGPSTCNSQGCAPHVIVNAAACGDFRTAETASARGMALATGTIPFLDTASANY